MDLTFSRMIWQYIKNTLKPNFWEVYVCVEIRRKHKKTLVWLSLAGKFMGTFYFLLNIFQILFKEHNFICLNMKNMK